MGQKHNPTMKYSLCVENPREYYHECHRPWAMDPAFMRSRSKQNPGVSTTLDAFDAPLND